MKLKVWLVQNNMTVTQLANDISYRQSYLSTCLTGTRYPGAQLIKVIEKFTNGEVGKNDWCLKSSLIITNHKKRLKNGRFIKEKK